jgi:hypothetical protein
MERALKQAIINQAAEAVALAGVLGLAIGCSARRRPRKPPLLQIRPRASRGESAWQWRSEESSSGNGAAAFRGATPERQLTCRHGARSEP